ncbi:MAG: 4Fe-4S dicluster domain-containing protein [Anaerolineae bacterium]|nr:4Fe-4S dicluster domain-containing protein [Anaerolineae bacterium]
MTEPNLYERLIRFYEFQIGEMPYRQEFEAALRTSLTEEDLRLFFLLPFWGMIPIEKLEQKAARIGMSKEEVHQRVSRLVTEGIIDSYVAPTGRVCGRSSLVVFLELQVLMKQESPTRAVCAKIMNAFIEGETKAIPTRTPYYRVLPVEATITGGSGRREIPVNISVPDPRSVLPIDIVSEMIRKEPLIAVADCYCRSTKRLLGEDCGHPMETCFYFNELAMTKLETGYARRIDYEEALQILLDCEQHGLVHNVSNCKGRIQTLCNCCSCACVVLRATIRGQRNVGGPSRFIVALDSAKCILCGECIKACPLGNFSILDHRIVIQLENCLGCGLCVSRCASGALHMVLRKRPPKIYRDNNTLFRRIHLEGILGLAMRSLWET